MSQNFRSNGILSVAEMPFMQPVGKKNQTTNPYFEHNFISPFDTQNFLGVSQTEYLHLCGYLSALQVRLETTLLKNKPILCVEQHQSELLESAPVFFFWVVLVEILSWRRLSCWNLQGTSCLNFLLSKSPFKISSSVVLKTLLFGMANCSLRREGGTRVWKSSTPGSQWKLGCRVP